MLNKIKLWCKVSVFRMPSLPELLDFNFKVRSTLKNGKGSSGLILGVRDIKESETGKNKTKTNKHKPLFFRSWGSCAPSRGLGSHVCTAGEGSAWREGPLVRASSYRACDVGSQWNFSIRRLILFFFTLKHHCLELC